MSTHADLANSMDEPIAIVGMACRLSGEATSLDGLWNMMSSSRTGHGEVPPDRWNADAWYHPDQDRKGAIAARYGFFLDQDISVFDAAFFSVTAKEAAGLDPQKRLLLEVAYEAFENAGMPLDKLAGTKTGVYVGCMSNDYEILSTHDMSDQPYMAASGSSEAMTANRVSWFFDLRGPSLTIDTACSSSLYALHLACQSLRLRETNANLVGGVNLILHPKPSAQLTAMHMLGKEGTSHSFDARADGYGRGEGIGSLVVKRLSDAVRDGDVIRAVIRASAVNADGQTASVTMPSGEAQADLIRMAYQQAGLSLRDTQYVEVHGTGTEVGDPIELSGIAATFGASLKPDEPPVYVGSIKPSVGHTEGCAGLADVFRAVLSLEKGYILPTFGVEQPNPKIKLAENNLALPPGVIPWPRPGQRRASVNSFGFGGANAHLILDDAYHYLADRGIKATHSTSILPLVETNGTNGTNGTRETENGDKILNRKRLFVLSAQGKPALTRLVERYTQYAASSQDQPQNVAYTLAQRRAIFDHRAFAVADTLADLHSQLREGVKQFLRVSKLNGLAWVFTGQGAQWSGMGKELLALFPVFAASVAKSNAVLQSMGYLFDLLTELQGSANINAPEYSQPICTALQVALVDLLKDWGVQPKAVVGHSSGEIAAMYAAGIITQEDAIKISSLRGTLSMKLSRQGAMLAAGISEEQGHELLEASGAQGKVVVACVNSPKSVTLSGDADVISQLEAKLNGNGVFARKLLVSTAYHSHHMLEGADAYLAALKAVGLSSPRTTETLVFSSVTGQQISHSEIDIGYWVRNMCQPVLFSQAATQLLTYSPKANRRVMPYKWNSLVEVGPHSALRAPLNQIMESVQPKLSNDIPYVSILQRHEDAATSALQAAGTLWALGYPLLLDKINAQDGTEPPPQVVPNLPPYPWSHEKRYWYEPRSSRQERLRQSPRTDLLGLPVDHKDLFEPSWRNFLSVRESPWIKDHNIAGGMIYPGAGMLVSVIEAAHELCRQRDIHVRGIDIVDVHFIRPLVIPSEGAAETLLSIKVPEGREDGSGEYTFAFYSTDSDTPWVKNCFGSFYIVPDVIADLLDEDPIQLDWKARLERFADIKSRPSQKVDVAKFYYELRQNGMDWGDSFRNLTSMTGALDGSGCYGSLQIFDTASPTAGGFVYPHIIHPTTLDSLFHLMLAAFGKEPGVAIEIPAVPYRLKRAYIATQLPSGAGSQFHGFGTRNKTNDPTHLSGNVTVSDETWKQPCVIIEGLLMKEVDHQSSEGSEAGIRRSAQLEWNIDPEAFLTRADVVGVSSDSFTPCTIPGVSGLGDWLRLECHKLAGLRLVVQGSKLDAQQIIDEILPWVLDEHPYRSIAQLVIVDAQEGLHRWQAAVKESLPSADASTKAVIQYQAWDPESGTPLSVDGQTFDIVLTGETVDSTSPLIHSLLELVPSGRLLSMKSLSGPASLNGTSNGVNSTDQSSLTIHQRQVHIRNGILTVASAKRQTSNQDLVTSDIVILLPQAADSAGLSVVAQEIQKLLERRGTSCEQLDIEVYAKRSLTDAHPSVISLLDLADPGFVSNWSPEQYSYFKNTLNKTSHILWVTQGVQMPSALPAGQRANLDAAAVPGLLRVLRNELSASVLIHLDLSPSTTSDSPTKAASLILAAFSTVSVQGGERKDAEFCERDNELLIPRCVPLHRMDEELALRSGKGRPILSPLSSTGPLMLPTTEGLHDGLVWLPDDAALLPLEAEEVEVCLTSISMPVSSYKSTSSAVLRIGEHANGIVTRVGCQVTGFEPGQLVITIGNGKRGLIQTHVRRHHAMLLHIPKPDEYIPSAAAVWLDIAASQMLTNVVRLAPGETVLVEDGADCLSQAVIAAARRNDARVLGTVSSESARSLLMAKYGLNRSDIIDSRAGDLSVCLRDLTGGRGVNALVTSSARFVARKDVPSWMAPFGRVLLVVDDEVDDHDPPSLKLGLKSLSIMMVNPRALLHDDTRLLQEWTRQASTSLQSGPDIGPVTVMSLSDLHKVPHFLERSDTAGILVIDCNRSQDIVVPVAPPKPRQLELDTNGTYILAGGLGEIGIRIATLMARHGAKHIVLLSRSGSKPKYDRSLAQISKMGCRMDVLRCDVTSFQDCQGVLDKLRAEGKVVRGVIQCAMVLADSIFEIMTYHQWQAAFAPKKVGTWNLHSLLPDADLDFFIMLSSIVAVIGNISQANYSAGNTWMDSLALYRRAQGTHGSKGTFSINGGAVFATDHVVNGASLLDGDYLDKYDHMKPVSTTLEELDICLEACMRQGCSQDDAAPELPAQFILGMTDALPVRHDQWTGDPKFMHRLDRASVLSGAEHEGSDEAQLAKTLAVATTLQEVTSAVINMILSWLGTEPTGVSFDKPLFSIGLDSFKAVEIKNHIFHTFQSEVSVFEMLSASPLSEVATLIALRSPLVSTELKNEAEGS